MTQKKEASKSAVKKKATSKKPPVKQGRPTKYRKGMAEEWLKHIERGLGKIQASHEIGVLEETVIEWSKIHEDFSVAYKKATEIDRGRLLSGGMDGSIPVAMALGLLKMNHAYMEQDKRENIALKREELDAKIRGDINDGIGDLNINFTEKTDRD